VLPARTALLVQLVFKVQQALLAHKEQRVQALTASRVLRAFRVQQA
jgi:hypothetical protein